MSVWVLSKATFLCGALSWQDTQVAITQTSDPQHGATRRPLSWAIDINVSCAQPTEFTLKRHLMKALLGLEVRVVK